MKTVLKLGDIVEIEVTTKQVGHYWTEHRYVGEVTFVYPNGCVTVDHTHFMRGDECILTDKIKESR